SRALRGGGRPGRDADRVWCGDRAAAARWRLHPARPCRLAALGAGGRRAGAHRPGQLGVAPVQPPHRCGLGLPRAAPASVLVGYIVLSTMPHANVNWGFGPLRYVIVSPAYHRLHHDRDDQRGVNLATVLVVWDVLAGLAVCP